MGQSLLLAASVGLPMAAKFPMDPAGTEYRDMSVSGRMHGIAFLVGVPGLFGWVNRLLMVAYRFWLIVVVWPIAY